MKLSPRDATGYLARPDTSRAGILIYGNDAMRVAMKRQELLANLLGPSADEEMRLARMAASELRKDPAMLLDAIKAVSFFPGQRAAFVEDATDASAAKSVSAALEDWRPGDATIVVTAGSLNAKSSLRKLFETHPNAYSLAIYDDPPTQAEIEAELKRAGVAVSDRDGMAAIVDLSRNHDPGEFRQTLEKIALYKIDDDAPLTVEDVQACAPGTRDAELDDFLHAVAEGQRAELAPLLKRLQGQGVQPVGLCIAATRHFRALHAAASDPGGASAGIARLRPPIFGPRRDRMQRQAQKWGMHRLEDALHLLLETDLTLRSAQKAPQMALVERSMIRLAMMGGK